MYHVEYATPNYQSSLIHYRLQGSHFTTTVFVHSEHKIQIFCAPHDDGDNDVLFVDPLSQMYFIDSRSRELYTQDNNHGYEQGISILKTCLAFNCCIPTSYTIVLKESLQLLLQTQTGTENETETETETEIQTQTETEIQTQIQTHIQTECIPIPIPIPYTPIACDFSVLSYRENQGRLAVVDTELRLTTLFCFHSTISISYSFNQHRNNTLASNLSHTYSVTQLMESQYILLLLLSCFNHGHGHGQQRKYKSPTQYKSPIHISYSIVLKALHMNPLEVGHTEEKSTRPLVYPRILDNASSLFREAKCYIVTNNVMHLYVIYDYHHGRNHYNNSLNVFCLPLRQPLAVFKIYSRTPYQLVVMMESTTPLLKINNDVDFSDYQNMSTTHVPTTTIPSQQEHLLILDHLDLALSTFHTERSWSETLASTYLLNIRTHLFSLLNNDNDCDYII
jgi:hypothetical protein